MKVLSLFDGMACGRIALDRLGIKPSVYLASEIDDSAITIAQSNWPDIIQLGDVKTVRAAAQAGFFGQIDLLLAGSPCQGFSTASWTGTGFEDERSRLYFEFLMIRDAIKPTDWMLENVKMKSEWLERIDRDTGVDGVYIDSADFTGQSRKRYYWSSKSIAPHDPHGPLLSDVIDDGWVSDRDKSYCIDANYYKGANFKRYFHKSSRQIVFKDGCVPQKPPIEQCTALQNVMRGAWRNLTVRECERLQTLPEGYTRLVNDNNAYKAIGNGWTVDVVAHVLGGMSL